MNEDIFAFLISFICSIFALLFLLLKDSLKKEDNIINIFNFLIENKVFSCNDETIIIFPGRWLFNYEKIYPASIENCKVISTAQSGLLLFKKETNSHIYVLGKIVDYCFHVNQEALNEHNIKLNQNKINELGLSDFIVIK